MVSELLSYLSTLKNHGVFTTISFGWEASLFQKSRRGLPVLRFQGDLMSWNYMTLMKSLGRARTQGFRWFRGTWTKEPHLWFQRTMGRQTSFFSIPVSLGDKTLIQIGGFSILRNTFLESFWLIQGFHLVQSHIRCLACSEISGLLFARLMH